MSERVEGPRNDAIVEALHNVAIHDAPERRAMLYQLLVDSTLVVATPDSGRTGQTSRAGESLALTTIMSTDGVVLPIFTDVDALLAWRPEGGGWTELPAPQLFEMAANADAVRIEVNPGSATTTTIDRDGIDAVVHGRLPGGGPEDQVAPEALDAVCAALEAHAVVERAYTFVMQQGDAEPTRAVAVGFRAGTSESVARRTVQEIVDSLARTSSGTHGWAFTVADLELERGLRREPGAEFFRR